MAADAALAAVTALDAAVCTLTLDFRTIYASEGFRALTGLAPEAFQADDQLFFKHIHPDDLEVVQQAASQLADEGQVEQEYRFIRPDGRVCWLHSRLRLRLDETLEPLCIDGFTIDVTSRRLLGDQLRAALNEADQFRRVFEMGNVLAAIADFDGTFQVLSPGWRAVMGYLPSSLVGRPFLELVHPEDLDRTAQEVLKLLATGVETSGFEVRFRCHDGSYRWLLWNITSDLEARRLYGVAQDVTERRIMEEALRSSEERLRMLAAQVPGCIYQFRLWASGRREFTYISEGVSALFGVLPEDVYAQQDLPWSMVAADELDRLWASLDESAATGEPWVLDFGVELGGGGRKIVHGHAHPSALPDGSILWSGLLTDITAQRRQEEELIRTREAALEASREKSRFLANMSHEIRTPMNGILGMTALALGTTLTPEQREYLEAVNQSGESLLAIINDILDISKIEARRMAIESLPFTLQRVVDEAVSSNRPRAREKGLRLDVTVAPGIPRHVVGDPLRIGQVLRNLLSNAVKFTEHGHVALTITPGETSPSVRFSVADTGPGIPDAQQQHIFEAFRQADGSTTRRYGGTGLGLSISRELAQLMGGRLWLESRPGAGSTFHCELPLAQAADDAATAAALARLEAGPASSDALGLHVLLAEDNPINARVASRMLQRLGCTVDTADTGSRVLAALDHGTFDLVLMDVQMPDMDGLEITRLVRAREMAAASARLPIIALTANAMKGDEDRCYAVGMDGYLSKPIAMGALAREMQRVIASRAAVVGE
ncbi:MAG: PAS domain-containing protein [Vicinamibacterales bacterium]